MHGNYSGLAKRDNQRLMLNFAIKGLQRLKEEKVAHSDNHKTFELVCLKYHELSKQYITHQKYDQRLKEEFQNVLDIDIE